MAKSEIEARRKAALVDGGAPYRARRDEIISAAAHVFRELGFDAATLRDVAASLGADRASLYYYIGSKEELLQEIVSRALDLDIAAAQAVAESSSTSAEKIRALIGSMVNSFATNYPNMNVYIEDLGRIARKDSEWSVEIVKRTKTYESLVHSILNRGRDDGTLRCDLPVELCALALFGMINWMHQWYRPTIAFSPQQIADTYTELFLSGYGTGS